MIIEAGQEETVVHPEEECMSVCSQVQARKQKGVT